MAGDDTYRSNWERTFSKMDDDNNESQCCESPECDGPELLGPVCFDDYQLLAIRTAPDAPETTMATMCALGLTGEAGEVAELIKKYAFHGHDLEVDKLTSELGDVLWYIAVLARKYDVSLSEVAQANVEKLKKRYPNGFSSDASKNRET
jgi:NTP pyrophosphatase (non-canonical NTP hydrolase)